MNAPAASTPRVSILVVATRDGPKLRACLEHLAAQSATIPFETFVILNGRPLPKAEQLERSLANSDERPASGVKVIGSAVHLGLSGALNRGRTQARGEFVVSLHDDTEPAADWLDALVGAADETGAGAIAPLVLNPDGSVQAAGWELMPDGITRPPWRDAPPPRSAFRSRAPVDYSPSCSLLVRASSWDRAGGADERFFPLVYVDVDLCLALRARGEQVVLEPAAVVMHHRGSSTPSDYQLFAWHRNRALLLEKWKTLVSDHAPGSGRTWSPPAEQLPHQDRQADEPARERAQLIRGVEVLDAYASQLRDRLAAMTEERDQTRAELERAHAALEDTRSELHGMRERLHAVESQLPWLELRAQTLASIEAGGWWRLRSRIRPLLRVASAARRLTRGAAR